MSLPGYPEYKGTGSDWLGEVPSHWEICAPKRRIRSAAGGTQIKGQCSGCPDEGLFPAFSASGQDVWTMDFDYSEPGLVLSAVGARCGKTFKADGEWGVVANTHCLFPREGTSRDFIWYLTNQEQWWEKGGTAQPFIKVSETLSRVWAFPPEEEQRDIAAFLDRETAKIDTLIAEQEKLIALLAEKRQATITRAVTRGLTGDVPMRESNIQWLGNMPAHWDVKALARITLEKCDGPFGSGLKSDHYTDSGALVIRLQNIRRSGYYEGDAAYVDLSYFLSDLMRHSVGPGDLLIAGLGDDNNVVGRACVAPGGLGPALVKADCFRFRLDATASSQFVAYQLNVSAFFDSGVLATGTTRSRIPLSVMSSRVVALPPIEEQVEIVEFISACIERFDCLVTEAQTAIALLKERRSALITAAVTGQIDVRGEMEVREAEAVS
jgi:type I restriction enzyme S subunit